MDKSYEFNSITTKYCTCRKDGTSACNLTPINDPSNVTVIIQNKTDINIDINIDITTLIAAKVMYQKSIIYCLLIKLNIIYSHLYLLIKVDVLKYLMQILF